MKDFLNKMSKQIKNIFGIKPKTHYIVMMTGRKIKHANFSPLIIGVYTNKDLAEFSAAKWNWEVKSSGNWLKGNDMFVQEVTGVDETP